MSAHYVYRGFDESGRVLYVGCTSDLERRLRQHARGVGALVARWDSCAYGNRADALRVERALIFFHQPRLNILGKHREPLIEIPRELTARQRKRRALADAARSATP